MNVVFPSVRSPQNIVLAAILLFAAALRTVAAILLPDQSGLLVDAITYRESAAELLTTHLMTIPYQMPLYPVLIAITGPGWGQLAADIALSVVTVWLVYELSRELFGNYHAAVLAALAAACYPALIFFAVVGLSETLYIALILAAFLAWYRDRYVIAAFFAVLATLTRGVFDFAGPLLVIVFALFVHRRTLKETLYRLSVYLVVYVALMTPWWAHNYALHGTFVRLTNGLGWVLYAGNNPMNHSGGAVMGVDYDLRAFEHIPSWVDRDKALRDAAVSFIRDNPGRFVELAGLKFLRMWRLWPHHQGYSGLTTAVISAASFGAALLFAAWGMILTRNEWRKLLPVYVFAIYYTLAHMVLGGTIRYRLPLEPFLLIFAAFGFSHILTKFGFGQRAFAARPASSNQSMVG